MKEQSIEAFQFITHTQLERSEPRNRFGNEGLSNPTLTSVLDEFPDIKERYNSAYLAYVNGTIDPTQTREAFLSEVYEPILITEAVIQEVAKLRKPKDSVPLIYNADAIFAIVESFNLQSQAADPLILDMIQHALFTLDFNESEFMACNAFHKKMLEIDSLRKNNQPNGQILQLKREAQQIIESLRPEKECEENVRAS